MNTFVSWARAAMDSFEKHEEMLCPMAKVTDGRQLMNDPAEWGCQTPVFFFNEPECLRLLRSDRPISTITLPPQVAASCGHVSKVRWWVGGDELCADCFNRLLCQSST
jgi:hypothetical protein